jgi:hypothetical protein
MSNSSGRSRRLGSRLAEPMQTSITAPAGNGTPSAECCMVVSGVWNRSLGNRVS